MAPTVNITGLYGAMSQIAKPENMVDRLELAEVAGCKTKSVEEISLLLASFRLLFILLFYICKEVNFHYNFFLLNSK